MFLFPEFYSSLLDPCLLSACILTRLLCFLLVALFLLLPTPNPPSFCLICHSCLKSPLRFTLAGTRTIRRFAVQVCFRSSQTHHRGNTGWQYSHKNAVRVVKDLDSP